MKRKKNTIRRIKGSRETEDRFMIFEEMLRDERAEGKAEGRIEGETKGCADDILLLLGELGVVPKELTEKIMSESDLTVLREYLKCAAGAESVEQFIQLIQ